MKKIIIALMGVLLITGCTTTGGSTQETKIADTEGIGILEFRAIVNNMLAETYNYVLLSVRNNAGGNNAKNIKASLDNVEPFTIYECNVEHKPSTPRASVCNQFFDDFQVPYRSHNVNQMIPDEELQFFWNIKAPSNKEIVEMSYDQTIYYTLSYDYTSTVTQTIIGISQEEYLERSREGPVTLSGQTISSPGEVKLESKTQQPLIYSEGSELPLDFTLEFEVKNTGAGIPTPGTRLLVAVKKGDLTEIGNGAGAFGWTKYRESITCDNVRKLFGEDDYDSCRCTTGEETDDCCTGTEKGEEATTCIPTGYNLQILTDMFDAAFKPIEFEELGAEDSTIRQTIMLTIVSSEQLSGSSYALLLPMQFLTQGIFEPQKILTVSAYISYNYLKEGNTQISVFPTE